MISTQEYDQMKKHCEFGVRIIQSGSDRERNRADAGGGLDALDECRSPRCSHVVLPNFATHGRHSSAYRL